MLFLRKKCLSILWCALLWWANPTFAVLKIDIIGGVEGAAPIAIIPFQAGGIAPKEEVSAIVAADLRRSGYFAPLDQATLGEKPSEAEQINYNYWRAKGVDNILIGKVLSPSPNQFTIQFQLVDLIKKQQLLGLSVSSTAADLRKKAHQISDLVFEAITGKKGIFSTRIAYVLYLHKDKQPYRLAVADIDGENEQIILYSKTILLSPAWSHNGQWLAYVTYEHEAPEIYTQNIHTAKRERLSAQYAELKQATSISAPAWAPDDKKLAFTMIKNGNSDIYYLDMQRKLISRISNHYEIDTEPAWTPDGKSIIFTSGRGGTPQLYKTNLIGDNVERLTFEGKYNARASVAPDGKSVAFIYTEGNNSNIAVLNMDRKTVQVFPDNGSTLHESPSFAPNGQMIVYAAGYKGKLSVVTVDGRFGYDVSFREGVVREPVWSPLLTN